MTVKSALKNFGLLFNLPITHAFIQAKSHFNAVTATNDFPKNQILLCIDDGILGKSGINVKNARERTPV